MVKVERGKRKRLWECMVGIYNELHSRNQQLDEVLKQNGEWRDLWKKIERSKSDEKRL